MTVYYVLMAVFLIPVGLILIGMFYSLVSHRMESIEKGINQARQDLLKKESTTGVSAINFAMYAKVSNEMLRDVGESEGFRFTGKSGNYLNFQRLLPGPDGEPVTPRFNGAINEDFGGKRQKESLQQALSTAGDTEPLTLRRDELKALPKAEILREAQEHGWVYRSEEISGNEWRLLFDRAESDLDVEQESAL